MSASEPYLDSIHEQVDLNRISEAEANLGRVFTDLTFIPQSEDLTFVGPVYTFLLALFAFMSLIASSKFSSEYGSTGIP